MASKSNQTTSSARATNGMARPSIDQLSRGAGVAATEIGKARLQLPARVRQSRIKVQRCLFEQPQAVVLAAVDVDDFAMALDGGDGRQEALALQSVAVELRRRQVRGEDQRDAAFEQSREQSAQQHGVGDVADEQFVQAQHAGVACDVGRHVLQRVGQVPQVAQFAETRVHVLHQAMEVLAPRRHADVRMEEIHQEGLAAADAAPEIYAALAGRAAVALARLGSPTAEETPLRTVLCAAQAHRQVRQAVDRMQLRGVRAIPVTNEGGLVFLLQIGAPHHASCFNCAAPAGHGTPRALPDSPVHRCS